MIINLYNDFYDDFSRFPKIDIDNRSPIYLSKNSHKKTNKKKNELCIS